MKKKYKKINEIKQLEMSSELEFQHIMENVFDFSFPYFSKVVHQINSNLIELIVAL